MKNVIITALCALTLVACVAQPKAVAPGDFASKAGMTLPLSSDWSHFPETSLSIDTFRGEYLTKDGPLLNRLQLVSVKDGEALMRGAQNADVPRFVTGTSELEQVEFVTQSLDRMGYSGMTAANIRPGTFDGQAGIRFDISGVLENGLEIRGDVAAVASGETLHLALFLAPAMHYYDATASEVNAALSAMRISG